MIDLHCHLLPGIDDGPRTLAESVAMARMAVADGITTCVVTPHIHPGRYDNHRERIEMFARAFRRALAQQAVALDVRVGAEVRVSLESLDLVQRGLVPFMGQHRGWNVLLLELPHGGVPVGSLQLVDKLLQLQIRPLLAHPERNRVFMDNPRRLEPYVAAGCWLQVTAGSITGAFGKGPQQLAHRLLDEDAVRVVASDAHNLGSRPPVLSQAHTYIGQHWGGDVANDLMLRYPQQLLGMAAQPGPPA